VTAGPRADAIPAPPPPPSTGPEGASASGAGPGVACIARDPESGGGGKACGPGPEPVSKKRARVEEDDVACGDPHIVSPDMEVAEAVRYIPIPLSPHTPPSVLPPPPPKGKGERKTRRPPQRPSTRGPPATGGTRLPEGPGSLEKLSSEEEVLDYIRRADEEADAMSRAEGSAAHTRPRSPPLLVLVPDPGDGVGPEFGSGRRLRVARRTPCVGGPGDGQ